MKYLYYPCPYKGLKRWMFFQILNIQPELSTQIVVDGRDQEVQYWGVDDSEKARQLGSWVVIPFARSVKAGSLRYLAPTRAYKRPHL